MQELLSLREIGRRLSIPPSSVAYYKDRFAPYIPTAGGRGRRIRYSSEALAIFKEIREMFEQNWSAEQVKQHLATVRRVATTATVEGLSSAEGAAAFDSAAAAHIAHAVSKAEQEERSAAFVQDISSVLDKMGSVLEAQAGFRAEIAALRNEVQQLRYEKAELVATYERKISELDDELERFKQEKKELVGLFLDEYYTLSGKSIQPPAAFLELPLVVQSGGEFLGVMGKGKPFTLKDLMLLMEQSAGNTMRWVQRDERWMLHVAAGEQAEEGRTYQFDTQETLTPSGNQVTELKAMSVDGEEVPQKFVLMLFKNVKEDFETRA